MNLEKLITKFTKVSELFKTTTKLDTFSFVDHVKNLLNTMINRDDEYELTKEELKFIKDSLVNDPFNTSNIFYKIYFLEHADKR